MSWFRDYEAAFKLTVIGRFRHIYKKDMVDMSNSSLLPGVDETSFVLYKISDDEAFITPTF